MHKFSVVIVALMATVSTASSQTLGLWARTADLCNQQSRVPGDWFVVAENGIRGYNFKCTFFTKEGNTETYFVDAFCGLNNSDVTFRDKFAITARNGILTIKSEHLVRSFVQCNR